MTTTLYVVPPEKLPLIARACHEANRTYCLSLGDTSQLPWEAAALWQQDSACKGVLGVLCNGNTPEQSHEGWMREKAAAGWTYGPVKDTEKLTHPCMLPYDQLPPEQQRKDHLFRDTCLAMARALGLDEVRRDESRQKTMTFSMLPSELAGAEKKLCALGFTVRRFGQTSIEVGGERTLFAQHRQQLEEIGQG